jgi:Icc protein
VSANDLRTLLHISDTHILPDEEDRLHGVDTFQNLVDVFDVIRDSGVAIDAIVLSGDLVDRGDVQSYRRLRAVLDDRSSRLGAQVVVAMGNHDQRAAFQQVMLEGSAANDPIDRVSWVGGLRLVVLDCTVPGAVYGEVRPDQLAWVQAELGIPAPEGSVLIMHHPPTLQPGPLEGVFTLHGAERLEDVVRGTDVVAVLAGHAHHAIASAFAGVLCYAAPAMAYTVDPLVLPDRVVRGVEGTGFGLIRVVGRRAVATTIALPSAGRETFRTQIGDDILERWMGHKAATGSHG